MFSACAGMGGLEQRGCFVPALDEVEVLDGDAGGAFDEVVEGGEDDDAAFDDAECDIAEIGVCGVFGGWEMG
jgi:hypothetical protein